jgi:hypothetical protein
VDELLDELSQAQWFSVLDLRAGFNQIRLAPGEEHKTAFQTHWGQVRVRGHVLWSNWCSKHFPGCHEPHSILSPSSLCTRLFR